MFLHLRCQLITTAGTMIKNDFPSKWPQFINQIHTCLSSDNLDAWESALLVYYSLVQHYEYVFISSHTQKTI